MEPIRESLEPGQTYRVVVNDWETTTFTLPAPDLRDTFIAESRVESAVVLVLESAPSQRQLRVVSGMPKGSGCSQFNGYEVRRREPHRIDVVITHHEVADPFAVCTADYSHRGDRRSAGFRLRARRGIHGQRKLRHGRVVRSRLAGNKTGAREDGERVSMRMAMLVCLAFVLMMAAACGDADAPACPEGTDPFVEHQLFMGRSSESGEVVDDAAWAAFLGETVTPRFPDGLTVLDAQGQWRDLGRADSTGALQAARGPGASGQRFDAPDRRGIG